MNESINVPWPAAPLSEGSWRRRLEDLAERAENLIGQPCSLQDTATLAMELIGLLWPALGEASTVAATCRASLVMGAPGVIVSSSPGDQWAAIHSQLDEIWLQAQQHPAAGVVELGAPVLSEVRPDALRRMGRPGKPASADADELPEAWRNCIEPSTPELEPEPEPVVITPDPPPPADWWSSADVGALLGLSKSQVSRRRRAGHLGEPGSGWVRCGRTDFFAPSIVEAALDARNKKPSRQSERARAENPTPAYGAAPT